MGTIDSSELGLQRITADMEFPADEAERFVQSFAYAPTWQLALRLLAAEEPPGGSPEELGQRVDQIMEDFPVQFLFTKTLIGADNASAVFRASTPTDHRRLTLAEQRAQQARMWGIFCAEALKRIGRRADRPDSDSSGASFRDAPPAAGEPTPAKAHRMATVRPAGRPVASATRCPIPPMQGLRHRGSRRLSQWRPTRHSFLDDPLTICAPIRTLMIPVWGLLRRRPLHVESSPWLSSPP